MKAIIIGERYYSKLFKYYFYSYLFKLFIENSVGIRCIHERLTNADTESWKIFKVQRCYH